MGLHSNVNEQSVSYGNFVKVTSPTQTTRSLDVNGAQSAKLVDFPHTQIQREADESEQLPHSRLYEWSRLYFTRPVVPCPQPHADGGHTRYGHDSHLCFRVEDEDEDPLSVVGAARSARHPHATATSPPAADSPPARL